jgi:hypothetical protein
VGFSVAVSAIVEGQKYEMGRWPMENAVRRWWIGIRVRRIETCALCQYREIIRGQAMMKGERREEEVNQ